MDIPKNDVHNLYNISRGDRMAVLAEYPLSALDVYVSPLTGVCSIESGPWEKGGYRLRADLGREQYKWHQNTNSRRGILGALFNIFHNQASLQVVS